MRGRRVPGTARAVVRAVGVGSSVAGLALVVLLAVVAVLIPRLTGVVPLTVLTSSMEPGLPPGTLIVVQKVDPDELAIGDIATYQIRSGEPDVVTHRIISISSTTRGGRVFTFQGDNNTSPDSEPVVAGQIQGRLWYSIPLLGFVNNAVDAESRAWIVPVAGGGLLAYAGYLFAGAFVSSMRKRRSGSPGARPRPGPRHRHSGVGR